jgi:hypothetical protein
MKTVTLLFAAIVPTILAAPYVIEAIPRRSGGSNIVDILPEGITDIASQTVDALPVDASVSLPIIPAKRETQMKRNPDLDVDMGGLDVQMKRNPDLDVDMGGLDVQMKRSPDLDVDMGGLDVQM